MRGDLGRTVDFWKASGAIIEGGIAGSQKVKSVLGRKMPVVLRYNATTKELWAAGPGAYKIKR